MYDDSSDWYEEFFCVSDIDDSSKMEKMIVAIFDWEVQGIRDSILLGFKEKDQRW